MTVAEGLPLWRGLFGSRGAAENHEHEDIAVTDNGVAGEPAKLPDEGVAGAQAAAGKKRKGGERRKATEARKTPEAEGVTTTSEPRGERGGGASEGEGEAELRTYEAVSRKGAPPQATVETPLSFPPVIGGKLAPRRPFDTKALAHDFASRSEVRIRVEAQGARPVVPSKSSKGHQVYVRMPEAMVAAVDKAVSDSPIEFGNQSDFIRRAVETELRRRGLLPNFK